MSSKKRYRLYMDESGDHTYKKIEEYGKRYLGITGVIIEAEYYRTVFQPEFEAFKQRQFPHSPDDPVILHREDIINKRGVFSRLLDAKLETAFNQDLLSKIENADYKLITAVIDKKAHQERYQAAALHPYHYCMAAMLERYSGFLNFYNAEGDVMAEGRGGKEDQALKKAYKEIFETGTYYRKPNFFQSALTSKEIKIKLKSANIAGLQFADMIAHPSKNEILLNEGRLDKWEGVFGTEICSRINQKYNRHHYDGRIRGYGTVFIG